MSITTTTLRPKRQVTIPQLLAQQLNWQIGDQLIFETKNKQLVVLNQNQAAQDTLDAIRKSLQSSGISLKEFLKDSRKIRKEIVREKYGDDFVNDLR
ncbi:MAG: hypothetical protein A2784_05190 [Candidatus Chisholmbacteria bacterium RIFCSPHIGHO2_01_FULL_48_12]|uniref:SpoVT-AbrB domain-containing protein n=1 Tax=Candidatus Chisholmbacteria bacterium RIFCSPHIGHO2_01_FULL_48_12 TaxID=1797589 RepID=A0A1G1VQ93_9BACT|nr:MAG: hypothetical protein A2784_05190 [Candidatus Chisholmbacteria bacterium RIFCSPHIGHO2_01_FULL_48_12]